MNKTITGLLALTSVLAIVGCTDAQQAKIAALGDAARVTCYSGGEIVFDDYSTGKIENEEGSDGFYFVSRTTNRMIAVTGDCTIDYGAKPDKGFQPVIRPVVGGVTA